MTGHPVVEAAAVALLHGMDPIAYLSLEGIERTVADAVLKQAQKMRVQELSQVAEAVGVHAGARVGEVLAKAFR
jgi:uncharacterized protein YunC (DUF1805 family)